jgi:hypothetical protein
MWGRSSWMMLMNTVKRMFVAVGILKDSELEL